MNITQRPIYAKDETYRTKRNSGDDPAYLARVRDLPCIICESFGMQQTSPTTAHHPIMGRGGSRRTPDAMAIPICDGHHQGTFDTRKIALHQTPKAWREAYGPDTDYVAVTQDKLEMMK